MKDILLWYIHKEAEKLAERHQMYHNVMELEYQRNCRRILLPNPKVIKIPDYWESNNKFNPFYVLKNEKQIVKSIKNKLENNTYKPFNPHIKEIEKPGGGKRKISVFQIPDAAVSNYIYHRLLSKNKHRFSSLAYAYRDDRNVHYAIQDISLGLKAFPRVFIAEFDFRDFFGSINHTYLLKQLDENGFLISEFEKNIIKSFIGINDQGIPLGTSISLFLANLVCWKLDRKLEEEGLRFARYADDTIIWSNNYSKICKSFEIIYEFSREAGISINFNKSEGISLLSKNGMPSEFDKRKEYVEFLGYKLSGEKISIKNKSVLRIKKQISYLLYKNLIQPINSVPFNAASLPSNNIDEAFITAIMQIRRYIYGDLNEDKIKKYLNGTYKRLIFKGVMSFYPLIDDEDQLKELDGWMVCTILNCLKLRDKLLKKGGINVSNQFPFNLTNDTILHRCRVKKIKGKSGLIEIPSFLRIHKAIKKGIINEGIEHIMNPKSNDYIYDD